MICLWIIKGYISAYSKASNFFAEDDNIEFWGTVSPKTSLLKQFSPKTLENEYLGIYSKSCSAVYSHFNS